MLLHPSAIRCRVRPLAVNPIAPPLPAAGTVWTAIPGGQSFTLKNIGAGAGAQIVDWKVYLSTNTVLDGGDMVVASGTATVSTVMATAAFPVFSRASQNARLANSSM